MNNSVNLARQSWLESNLPSIRVIAGKSVRKNSEDAHECNNFCALNFLTSVRYWLYFDMLPSVPDRKVQAWLRQFVISDFALYTEALDAVYELFRRERYLTLTVSQFKSALKQFGFSPNALLGPVWPEVERTLVNQSRYPDPYLVRRVVQWARIDSRVTFDNPLLESECSQRFQANQDRLRDLWSASDPYRDQVLSRMRLVIKGMFPDSQFEPQPGHHGSGAVANPNDGRSVTRKCLHLGDTDQLLAFYTRRFNVDARTDVPEAIQVLFRRGPLIRESRWLTVPKSVRKRRGIAPQPAVLMWYQQGILDGLYKTVWDKPYVQEHFPIFDRSVNQRIAIAGSKYDHWSTYDLSDASDSVTTHLVKAIFGPRLRLALLACRCYGTSEHPAMETYGTMGDATVFPTECLAIGAAVQVALIEAREHDPLVQTHDFYVFGDDICVQNRPSVHEAIHRVFAAIGFKINDEKSFFSGPYRESCGVEAYRGEEIQPWYILNRKTYPQRRANCFAMLVSAANHAYWRGLKLTRCYLLREAARISGGISLLPFTEVPTDASKVFTPFLSERGRYRRHPDTQEPQVLSYTTVSKVSDELYEEIWEQWYEYYMYLLKPPARDRLDLEVRQSFLNRDLHIRKSWTDIRLLEV